jgi:hypothetical protein
MNDMLTYVSLITIHFTTVISPFYVFGSSRILVETQLLEHELVNHWHKAADCTCLIQPPIERLMEPLKVKTTV